MTFQSLGEWRKEKKERDKKKISPLPNERNAAVESCYGDIAGSPASSSFPPAGLVSGCLGTPGKINCSDPDAPTVVGLEGRGRDPPQVKGRRDGNVGRGISPLNWRPHALKCLGESTFTFRLLPIKNEKLYVVGDAYLLWYTLIYDWGYDLHYI